MLPSSKAINTMNLEISNICKQQIAESVAEKQNLTILRDGTTQKGKQFSGVKISLGKEMFTLGLKEVAKGDAENSFKITKEMISDVEKASVDKGNKVNIVKSISSCMTDKCATEMKVTKMLLEEKLHENEGLSLETLNHDSVFKEKEYTYEIIDNFQCAMHRLQFSYEVEKVLKNMKKVQYMS